MTILTKAILALLVVILLLWFHKQVSSTASTQSTKGPVVGIRNQRSGWLWARWKSIWDTYLWMCEGYTKYSAFNKPFIIPTLDLGPTLIIPQQQIKAVYSLPETVLDVHETQDESMQLYWIFPDPHLHAEKIQFNVVRNQLTQNIPKVTPRVAAEIQYGFDRSWGNDREWKEVRVWSSALRIVAGAANGAFCGPPLCRDVKFLDRMKDHTMAIFMGALLLNCTPPPLHFVFGPVLTWVSGFFAERAMKRSRPFVKERLEKTAQFKAVPKFGWTPPNDALQWIIDECYASKDPDIQLDPHRVTTRLLYVNNISMLTTAYTAQNFILDLFSTDPSLGYVEVLRQECEDALRETGGKWSFETVKRLRLVDSAIRESMRMSPFGTLTLPRKILDPSGIKLENWDAPVPKHTRIAVPTEAIQYDETIYPNPYQYNPFRFAHPDDSEDVKVKSTVTLDHTFLGFGTPGRFACPGRFFALLEIKIFVADVLLNYDVEFLKARPKPIYMMWARYPPDIKIRIRRKADDKENAAET